MKVFKLLVFLAGLALLVLVGNLYANFTGQTVYSESEANITRVIDGDSIVTSKGEVRLLGVNAPEKGGYGYDLSTSFLERFEKRQVTLVSSKDNQDQYGRKLRYIFYRDININKQLLKKGLAHVYYYKQDKFTEEMKEVEQAAREAEKGIWKESSDKCASCIEVAELNEVDPGEYVVLENECDYSCDLKGWKIKDDANHVKKLNLELRLGQQKKIGYEGRIWNDDGDSLYLRDERGLLVLFYRY